jgi:zinc/manganese transport system substrate-binding protein
MRSRLGILLVAGLVQLAAASGTQAQERLRVVATFSILGDMVSRVGGDRIEVKTLVGPGGDAHVYQPTPADAAELAKARLVFQNGLKFEGWMEKLIEASGYRNAVITATKGIETISLPDRQAKRDKHGHDHSGKADPHAWQSLANAVIYARNIKDALCRLDIHGCATYAANAAAYVKEIERLDSQIKAQMAAVPPAARKVITSHDAFTYFSRAYGIRFLSPRGISTESEASAKDVARLIGQIRKENVKALFVENISDPRLIKQIGRETGVALGGTLYSDALSARGGPAATYLDMMRHNARLIAGALGAGS